MGVSDFRNVARITHANTQAELPNARATIYYNNLLKEMAAVIRRLDTEQQREVAVTFLLRDQGKNPRPHSLSVSHAATQFNRLREREIFNLSISDNTLSMFAEFRSIPFLTLDDEGEVSGAALHRLYENITSRLSDVLDGKRVTPGSTPQPEARPSA